MQPSVGGDFPANQHLLSRSAYQERSIASAYLFVTPPSRCPRAVFRCLPPAERSDLNFIGNFSFITRLGFLSGRRMRSVCFVLCTGPHAFASLRLLRPGLSLPSPAARRAKASTTSCRARRTRSRARSAGRTAPCPPARSPRTCRSSREPRMQAAAQQVSRRRRPRLPAETAALVAPGEAATRPALKAGDDLPAPLPRRQADQFRQDLAAQAGRSRRRRVALAGRDRLGEAAQPGREFRLHQGDRRRRPSRSDVQEELACGRARPA